MRVEKRVDGVILRKFTAVDDIVVVMDMGGGDVVDMWWLLLLSGLHALCVRCRCAREKRAADTGIASFFCRPDRCVG